MASMAWMDWVTALKRRELSNEMLRYSPLKTWQCSSTKQAWEADGSRSSRRVDEVKVKKEVMGSQIWVMVVTLAWSGVDGGVDGVDGGFDGVDGVDGGFDGSDGHDGVCGGGGFDGFDGLDGFDGTRVQCWNLAAEFAIRCTFLWGERKRSGRGGAGHFHLVGRTTRNLCTVV